MITSEQALSKEFDPAVLAGTDAPLDQFAFVNSGVGETRGWFSTRKKKVLVGGAAMLASLGVAGHDDVAEAEWVCVGFNPETGECNPGQRIWIDTPTTTLANRTEDNDNDGCGISFNPNDGSRTPVVYYGIGELDDSSPGQGQAGLDQLLADMNARGLKLDSYDVATQSYISSVGWCVAPEEFAELLPELYSTPATTTTAVVTVTTAGENATATTSSIVAETSESDTTQGEMGVGDGETSSDSGSEFPITPVVLLGVGALGLAVSAEQIKRNNSTWHKHIQPALRRLFGRGGKTKTPNIAS